MASAIITAITRWAGRVYGNPEVTTGGRALKFYASVRIEIRKTESLKNGSEVYGNRVKCKVVAERLNRPLGSIQIIGRNL